MNKRKIINQKKTSSFSGFRQLKSKNKGEYQNSEESNNTTEIMEQIINDDTNINQGFLKQNMPTNYQTMPSNYQNIQNHISQSVLDSPIQAMEIGMSQNQQYQHLLPVDPEKAIQQQMGMPIQQQMGMPIQQQMGMPIQQQMGMPIQQQMGMPIQQQMGMPIQQQMGMPIQQQNLGMSSMKQQNLDMSSMKQLDLNKEYDLKNLSQLTDIPKI
jgi:hypothetical protein